MGIRLQLLDGMEAEEHHGLDASTIPEILAETGWSLRNRKTFEFGLNNLFVLRAACALATVCSARSPGSSSTCGIMLRIWLFVHRLGSSRHPWLLVPPRSTASTPTPASMTKGTSAAARYRVSP